MFIPLFLLGAVLLVSAGNDKIAADNAKGDFSGDSLRLENEVHLKNIRQLSFGGENAECYFSPDGTKFSFQSTHGNLECDQIFSMDIDGNNWKMVSTGKGRTTCSYYLPDNKTVLFASTHEVDPNCPPKPDLSQGYVWALYDTYDIYTADESGTDLKKLTNSKGYDAEATISPVGDKIVFTSTRSGDIEIYTMNLDGSDVTQLTSELGYDGGPFFSNDGKKIIYRRTTFRDEDEINEYKTLLAQGLIKPSQLDIWIMDADGSNKRQITDNSSANFAPFFFPDGEKILFCSNIDSENKRNFDVYKINIDGTGLERITWFNEFDGFPMFSPDGKKLVFCSNRNGKVKGETNIFICDWVD
ncbi:MAG: PD40 domain-containing protein [Bacteroidetes bacterium]|nr:PD40 domain-containing protein [Bacteroidota bacterium]